MSPGRLAAEKLILLRNFPAFSFTPDHLRVDGTLRSNSGKAYQVRLDRLELYPNAMPRVMVTAPPLYTHTGRPLWEMGVSARMHTLQPEGTWVQVCHGRGDRWEVRDTLHVALMKARLWVEAYEIHLTTGHYLDRYLPHQ